MKMKKLTAMGMAALMAATMIPAVPVMAEGEGKVYYLNFKPEADEAWQNLAKAYTEETGTEVTVVTAASGQYETTLQSEMAKSDAPTLFQVNGPVGLKNWKDYCYDLKDSEIYSQLTSDAYALKDGESVPGIAYVIESYGLIVNKTLLEKAGYTLDDIKSYDQLKTVADDIQSKKDELGIKGAFTSAGMDASSDWRFKTHLANLPIYYEYKDEGVDDAAELKGTYLENYKNLFDLYITDSTCDPAELSAKTADDSRNEFVKSEAVFYQNGSWEYAELAKTFSDEELAMIPIYFGVDDENQGLATGTENYWCVNKNASEEDIQATLDFMNWCVTSETGTKAMSEDMGFTIPFKTAVAPTNVFVKQDAEYTEAGLTPVSWNFTTMPSEEWKNGVGTALTSYAAETGSWDDVASAFVDNWAMEKALTE
ncbi:ABC transporter substrate-binding protein [Blautia sp.]|uniref:ABC transporter substrate-binding protein n=1 Tax=Blautia sp. TaxID=1955243 RepID=UPI00257C023B|nr:ABC transporter substrate-binding protein [Blautia sp.]MBS7174459.1 ABC transporter substrate-binding protein [Blautia sp.]